jgi:hypothetical protein
MNLDALWQRNRRFVLGFAGGVLGFFLLLWMLTSSAAGRAAAADRALSRSTLDLRDEMYGEAQEREAEERLAAARALNADLGARALPLWRNEFRIPPGKAPAQHYIERTGELRQDLIAWALRNDCEVDETLGLPPVSPTQQQAVERVLRGLDVAERVVRLAVEYGARSVEKMTIAERSLRAGAARGAVLDLTPVELEVVFEGNSPAPFLRALLAEGEQGRPIGLAGIEVAPPNPRKRERRVLLEFAVGVLPQVGTTEAQP